MTNHQLQDESSSEVQYNTEKRKTFEGAADETVPLTSLDSSESERTSIPVRKSFVPRPNIPQSLLLHQAERHTSSKPPGTPLRTPHQFSKPSIAKVLLVSQPNSLPAPTVPIPTTSGATTLSIGTSQNFNIFNVASNLKIDKFKGDNTQNVDT